MDTTGKFSMHKPLPDLQKVSDSLNNDEADSAESEKDYLESVLTGPLLSESGKELLQSLQERFSFNLRVWKKNFPDDSTSGRPGLPRYLHRDAPRPIWLHRFLTDLQISSEIQRAWVEEGFFTDDPRWLEDLIVREKAGVARCFLLSGNINDYAFDPAAGYRPVQKLVIDRLLHSKEMVLHFSLSQGIEIHQADSARQRIKLPPELEQMVKAKGLNMGMPVAPQICGIFDCLRRWFGQPEGLPERGTGIIIDKAHLLFPEGASDMERNFLVDALLNWSTSPGFFQSPHCIILLAESLEDVSNDLRSQGGKIEQINISLPVKPEERLKFLLAIMSPQSGMAGTRFSSQVHGIELEGYEGGFVRQLIHLAFDTAGLTLMGIEDLLQEIALKPSRKLTRDRVMEGKRERLRQESGGLLEVLTPRLTLNDIGGYDAVKTRIREMIKAISNRHDRLVRSTIPMGMLFLGPPGTGKTITAEAIAKESNISFVKMGDFRGMYVGQSERNLSRILGLIQALNPVIVFMDELDQSEGSRGESGDSGVNRRIFGRLLQFMSDTAHRGEIIWIGASNRPELIDSAMKRPGRFDLVMPFLLPDKESRKEILRKLLVSKTMDNLSIRLELNEPDDYIEIAEKTEGYSGAEIEAIVNEVIRRVIQKKQDSAAFVISRSIFDEVFSWYMPPYDREDYQKIEDAALREICFLDLLPEEYRERRKRLSPKSHR